MFNLENKDGTGNILDGLAHVIVVALCLFAPLVLVGIFYPHTWALVLVGVLGGGLFAKLGTAGSWKNIIGWATVAGLAGLLFGLFGV